MATSPSTPGVDAGDLERWNNAGLDRLTGSADGPGLGPPRGLVGRLDVMTSRLRDASTALGHGLEVDGPEALAARADILGLSRNGRVSCGGSSHLILAADGWFAVSLARPDDWDLLPAWIGVPAAPIDDWSRVHERCGDLERDDLVSSGAQLGLPIGALPDHTVGRLHAAPETPTAIPAAATSRRRTPRPIDSIRVADLSSMWAGPLCGSVLAAAGAAVMKVESLARPDGTRKGPPEFHHLLNGAKDEAHVDLTSEEGAGELEDILRSVDVVIESSRPRALRHLGIHAERLLADPAGPDVWISVTGHGRSGAGADRVAFGDDAAVSGGLVVWNGDEPNFCADAIADPLTGLTAATLALEALRGDTRVLLDVSMAGVAEHFAGCAVRAEQP